MSILVNFVFTIKKKIDRYKKWMDDFPASTEHLPVNELNSCTGSLAVHRIQHKLNLLSSEIFPLLGDNGIPRLREVFETFKVFFLAKFTIFIYRRRRFTKVRS